MLRESYLNHATVNEVLNLEKSMTDNTDSGYIVKGGKIYFECNNIRSESDDAGLPDNM